MEEMTIEQLISEDATFTEGMFITKVDNIFKKLLSSVMLNNLSDVDHFVSDDVFNFYQRIININNQQNQRQMYDELNVASTEIDRIYCDENYNYIDCTIRSKYLDYVIDLNTGNNVRGNDQVRVEVTYKLVFSKKKGAKVQGISRYCPGCGHPLNVNESGKCSFCGAIYNQEDYDWVLSSIERV